jgi:hypothetical protein
MISYFDDYECVGVYFFKSCERRIETIQSEKKNLTRDPKNTSNFEKKKKV